MNETIQKLTTATCKFCKLLLQSDQGIKCTGSECPIILHANCFGSISEVVYFKGCQFVCKDCAIRREIESFLNDRKRNLPFEPRREKATYENKICYDKNSLLALRDIPASKVKPENKLNASCFKTTDESPRTGRENKNLSNIKENSDVKKGKVEIAEKKGAADTLNQKNQKNKPPKTKKQIIENTPASVNESTRNKQTHKDNIKNNVLVATDTSNEANQGKPSEEPEGSNTNNQKSKPKRARAKKDTDKNTTATNEKIYMSQAHNYLNNKSSKSLSFEDIQNRLNIFLKAQISVDDILGWITLNVGYRIVEEEFIRALSNAVFENCIVDNQVSHVELTKNERLLEHFIRNITKYEVESLYSLQNIVHKLHHPPGCLLFICFKLYSDNIISKEGFNTWKSCQKVTEQEGKDIALQQLDIFFKQIN